MEDDAAVDALAALAHPQRLKLFRLLVQVGPTGLSAGVLADRLNLPGSTLSGYLSQLERASLLRTWRRQRHVYYAIRIDGARQLVDFLTQDCCQGHPEICGIASGLDDCREGVASAPEKNIASLTE